MGLTINNNVASLTAQNNLSKTNSALSSSLEKLSTGLKVNRGADGPSALVISEKQRAQISGLKTALDNTSKAVALVQTGEGALNELNSLLNKARSLALDSANAGVNDTNAYSANQAELSNILTSINRIASTTEFNGKKLLDGSGAASGLTTTTAGASFNGTATGSTARTGGYTFTVATAAQRAQAIAGTAYGAAAIAADAGNVTLAIAGKSATFAVAVGDTLDQVVGKANAALAANGIGTVQASNGFNGGSAGRLVLTATDFTTDITVSGTAGTLTKVGIAAGANNRTNAVVTYADSNGNTVSSTGVGNTVALNGELSGVSLSLANSTVAGAITSIAGPVTATAGTAFSFQIGSNANQTASVAFAKVTTDSIGNVGANFLSNAAIDSAANAQTAIGLIDQAISDVSNFRSRLGAFQANTLESTANSLRSTLENATAAESVIRDTDFAEEIANFTKLQTQNQAGATVLGNANQLTQLVAQLLRG